MQVTRFLYRTIFTFVVGLFSFCGNNNPGNNVAATTPTAAKPSLSPDQISACFDHIEHLFMNDNWLVITGGDSSFFYCSRLGKMNCKVYEFKIVKGDSTATQISEIKLVHDSVLWVSQQENVRYFLRTSSDTELIWGERTGNRLFRFEKSSDGQVSATREGQQQSTLNRTGPLSLFLVASRYDFLHGTKLAFKQK